MNNLLLKLFFKSEKIYWKYINTEANGFFNNFFI